jgi:hypothetical protein
MPPGRLDGSSAWRKASVLGCESQHVGVLGGEHPLGLAGPVPGRCLDPEQDGRVACLVVLELGAELVAVGRCHPVVVVTGEDQRRRIRGACDRLFGHIAARPAGHRYALQRRRQTPPRPAATSPPDRLPAINRRGSLYVIIGRMTCSAAQNIATMLQQHTNATFVGEPSGSPPNCQRISVCSQRLQRVGVQLDPALAAQGHHCPLDRGQQRCASTCRPLQMGLARHRPDVVWLLGVRPDPVGCALLAGARLDRPSASNACQGPGNAGPSGR